MSGAAPAVVYRDVVQPEWIDRNRHLNVGYFMVVFDFATDAFLDSVGLTMAYKEAHNVSTFAVEAHATYQRELRQGDPLCVTTQLLEFTTKKIHFHHRMYHETERYLAASNEILSLHMDMTTRRPAPIAPEILTHLETLKRAQAHLPRPPEVGRVIGVAARRPAI